MTLKPLTLVAAAALLAATQMPAQAGSMAGHGLDAAFVAGQADEIGYHRHGHTNCGHCQGNQGR